MLYAIVAAVGLVIGSVGMFVVFAVLTARSNRRRKARGKAADTPKIKRMEFSKLILTLVMLTYFIAVAVGVRLSFIDFMQYSTLAMLVGAPTAVAIGFYAWKAKCENVLKYKKDNPKETEGANFDPSNIQ